MAIFGTLEEMPLPEILTMLGSRTGKLHLSQLPRKQSYDLYLDKTHLKAFHNNGKALVTDLLVREAMLKISSCEQGTFDFERLSPDKLKQNLNIPITKLLLQIATAIDEIRVHRNHFADSRIKFKSVDSVDIGFDNTLYDFWQSSISLLKKGASAKEIAQCLSLDIELVQYNLYKLRSLGKVFPVRAFEQSNSKSNKDISLRKNIEGKTYQEIIAWLQTTQSEASDKSRFTNETRTNKPFIPQKGLINRLLKALSGNK